MNIDELLLSAQMSNHATALVVAPSWGQGRTVFGGISAGMLYRAMKQQVDPERQLRSMNVCFAGPLMSDEPFTIELELLREGKSLSHLIARAVQNGDTAILSQASFGNPRESSVIKPALDKHDLGKPGSGQKIKHIPNVTPDFIQHFDLNLVRGALPYTGGSADTAELGGWMRFADTPDQFTDAHLITLIDAWPPAMLSMLNGPSPASTVSWNIEFIHPHAYIAPGEWIAYHAKTRQSGAGYGHAEASIWDEKGELIAISRQAVAMYG